VYYFRKATLKTADKRYSSLNNDYEMTFSSETEVSQCDDDDTNLSSIPTVSFSFVPISQLESYPPNSTIGSLHKLAVFSHPSSRELLDVALMAGGRLTFEETWSLA